MRKIIGIGETVLDVVFRNEQPRAAVPGGSTFNALISLGRSIGKETPQVPILMVTETGDDHIGDIVMQFMQDNGLRTDYVVRHPGTQTHISMAFLDANNDAQYEFYKDHAHARIEPESVANIQFAQDDIVIFGSFFAVNPVIRDVTRSLIQRAHDAHAIIYYDINFRRNHIADLPQVMDSILENCRMSDIVRGSTDDFFYLLGTKDARDIYDNHLRSLCPNLIVTNGGEAIEAFSPEGHCTFRPLRCKTVSTIGAGDSFNAGIVYALIRYGFFKNGSRHPLHLNAAGWDLLVRWGRRFSANVCRSMYNYVDPDFMKPRQ